MFSSVDMMSASLLALIIGFVVGIILSSDSRPKKVVFYDADAINKKDLPKEYVGVPVNCGPGRTVSCCVLEVEAR